MYVDVYIYMFWFLLAVQAFFSLVVVCGLLLLQSLGSRVTGLQ